MDGVPEVSLILPAYNEAGSIARTIEEALAYFDGRGTSHEIIVAVAGTDGTREIVEEIGRARPNVRALWDPARRGKGYALRQAVPQARGQIVGFADADNKTPISEYDKIEPLLRSGCDVAIGSRALGGARIERRQPLYRRLGAKAFALIMHTLIGLPDIPDTQCGFKFFHREVARDIFARQQVDGYMYDVEILLLARRAGYRIGQVPVRWRDDGDSRLDLIWGNIQNMRDIISLRWRVRGSGRVRPAVG